MNDRLTLYLRLRNRDWDVGPRSAVVPRVEFDYSVLSFEAQSFGSRDDTWTAARSERLREAAQAFLRRHAQDATSAQLEMAENLVRSLTASAQATDPASLPQPLGQRPEGGEPTASLRAALQAREDVGVIAAQAREIVGRLNQENLSDWVEPFLKLPLWNNTGALLDLDVQWLGANWRRERVDQTLRAMAAGLPELLQAQVNALATSIEAISKAIAPDDNWSPIRLRGGWASMHWTDEHAVTRVSSDISEPVRTEATRRLMDALQRAHEVLGDLVPAPALVDGGVVQQRVFGLSYDSLSENARQKAIAQTRDIADKLNVLFPFEDESFPFSTSWRFEDLAPAMAYLPDGTPKGMRDSRFLTFDPHHELFEAHLHMHERELSAEHSLELVGPDDLDIHFDDNNFITGTRRGGPGEIKEMRNIALNATDADAVNRLIEAMLDAYPAGLDLLDFFIPEVLVDRVFELEISIDSPGLTNVGKSVTRHGFTVIEFDDDLLVVTFKKPGVMDDSDRPMRPLTAKPIGPAIFNGDDVLKLPLDADRDRRSGRWEPVSGPPGFFSHLMRNEDEKLPQALGDFDVEWLSPQWRRMGAKGAIDALFAQEVFAHGNDGSIFKNRPAPGRSRPGLPIREHGYYREFVGYEEGMDEAGITRIVIGREGDVYETLNHYGTVKIDNESIHDNDFKPLNDLAAEYLRAYRQSR